MDKAAKSISKKNFKKKVSSKVKKANKSKKGKGKKDNKSKKSLKKSDKKSHKSNENKVKTPKIEPHKPTATEKRYAHELATARADKEMASLGNPADPLVQETKKHL